MLNRSEISTINLARLSPDFCPGEVSNVPEYQETPWSTAALDRFPSNLPKKLKTGFRMLSGRDYLELVTVPDR